MRYRTNDSEVVFRRGGRRRWCDRRPHLAFPSSVLAGTSIRLGEWPIRRGRRSSGPPSTRAFAPRPDIAEVSASVGLRKAANNPEEPGGADVEWQRHELYCRNGTCGCECECGCECDCECANPRDPCTEKKMRLLKLVGAPDPGGWITRYGELLELRHREGEWQAAQGAGS